MKFSLLYLLVFVACTFSPKKKDSEDLFKEYMRIKDLPEGIYDLKGEESNSLYLSSAVFSYSCDSSFVNFLQNITEFPEQNNFNERFRMWSVFGKNYLETIEYILKQDLSMYSIHFDEYRKKFDKNNCQLVDGLIFPYRHILVIDTTAYNVLHLVDEIRD